jgi:hypothetical protein
MSHSSDNICIFYTLLRWCVYLDNVTSDRNHIAPYSPIVEYQNSEEMIQNTSPIGNHELGQQTDTSIRGKQYLNFLVCYFPHSSIALFFTNHHFDNITVILMKNK